MDRESPQIVILRILAFAIDALGMLFLLILPATLVSYAIVFTFDSPAIVSRIWRVGLVLFVAGVLVRDAWKGRSPGKRLLGLVILTPKGPGCGLIRSIFRNIPLVVPGWNVIELLLLLFTRQSRRSGDRIARTTVEQE
jgi:uncharacterized RDD family membrane protein YckC